jgi:hypothetical protein
MGWAVFRRVESRLVWGDALVHPECPGAAAVLLDAALAEQEPGAIDAIEGWFPTQPRWWSRQIEELGFVPTTEPRGLRMIYICVGPARRDENSLIERLYYTMGDTDLF